MYRFIAGFLLIVGVLGVSAQLPPAHTAQAGQLSPACQALNNPAYDGIYITGTLMNLDLWANERIVIRASNSITATLVRFYLNNAVVASTPYPNTLVYVVPQDYASPLINWDTDAAWQDVPTWEVSCGPAVGCDTLMPMTPDAVVGRFVHATPLYFAPEQMIAPAVTMPAGKTAWVLGKDTSGDYYQIVWACDKLWVPVDAIGPNVGDPVWQGAPLPTGVVE